MAHGPIVRLEVDRLLEHLVDREAPAAAQLLVVGFERTAPALGIRPGFHVGGEEVDQRVELARVEVDRRASGDFTDRLIDSSRSTRAARSPGSPMLMRVRIGRR